MSAYDLSIYDQKAKLAPGIAAIFSFCCGIAGMIIGMSQVWYVGPVALKAGEARTEAMSGSSWALLSRSQVTRLCEDSS